VDGSHLKEVGLALLFFKILFQTQIDQTTPEKEDKVKSQPSIALPIHAGQHQSRIPCII
jgi:hypothetical protein